MDGQIIVGRLVGGVGVGKHFTRLDWARKQFIEKVDIDPFPGTLNIDIVDHESRARWSDLKVRPGIFIDNPNDGPHDCDARCYRVSIEDRVDAAIVLPEVEGYAANTIELIAAAGVRDALGLQDGDLVRIRIK